MMPWLFWEMCCRNCWNVFRTKVIKLPLRAKPGNWTTALLWLEPICDCCPGCLIRDVLGSCKVLAGGAELPSFSLSVCQCGAAQLTTEELTTRQADTLTNQPASNFKHVSGLHSLHVGTKDNLLCEFRQITLLWSQRKTSIKQHILTDNMLIQ